MGFLCQVAHQAYRLSGGAWVGHRHLVVPVHPGVKMIKK